MARLRTACRLVELLPPNTLVFTGQANFRVVSRSEVSPEVATRKQVLANPLLQTPVALLVALGLTNSGETWRQDVAELAHLIERAVLTLSGSCWQYCGDGFKGRRSRRSMLSYGSDRAS